jgi:uncharacterized membrane protein YfcA
MVTSMGSTWSHQKRKTLHSSAVKMIIPGLVIGCISGAIISNFLSNTILKEAFGIMALIFAVYFFFPKLPQIHIAEKPNKSLLAFGFAVGNLSSLLGVGGGIFLIPVLLGYKIPLQSSIATSSAGTLTTAFTGSLAYLVIAQGQLAVPDTFGYIQIPAFLTIGACSLITTSLGAKLAHTLPPSLIKRIFATVLGATGLAMLLN